MTATLTDPFVPADVDLRAFRYMPLHVAVLKQSKAWRIARRSPALGFYMINLWTSSWHELPAGSLEDDDEDLCERAMCDPRIWPKVREKVMRGWVKCSDGRFYHQFVAEVVSQAWTERQERHNRTEAARLAKKSKPKGSATNPVTTDATTSATGDVTKDETEPVATPATSSVTSSNGREGNRRKEGRESPPPLSLNAVRDRPAEPAAGVAWDFLKLRAQHWPDDPSFAAPYLTLQTEAAQFLADGGSEKLIFETVDRGMASMAGKGKGPPTSLRAFRLSIADAIASQQPDPDQPLLNAVDIVDRVLSDDDWRKWMGLYTGPDHRWMDDFLGPRPGQPGCKVPVHIQAEFQQLTARAS